MKYIDEYRDKKTILALSEEIRKISTKKVSFMEVCGGHTMAIQKFGIPSLLPDTIDLLSGPGCPVCVSSKRFIDQSVAYSRIPNTIVCTLGDLIRVPGSSSSLDKEKAAGRQIKLVYSILDAIRIAEDNKDKNVIFLGIGFETTAPTSAAGIQIAKEKGLNNFTVFSSHKIMPPALGALIDDGVQLSGYIAPGHVSTITGSKIYSGIAEKYGLSIVVSGFEPADIMQSILMLVKQQEQNDPKVEIQYKRVVTHQGNILAQKALDDVFELREDWWRGLGNIPASGLGINDNYADFDAEKKYSVEVEETREEKGCICGLILKGQKKPKDCNLYGKTCNPVNPIGACMVSSEGACHAYYKYNR